MNLNKILIFLLIGIFFAACTADAHRRKHHKAYGAVWDESQSSPTLERIGQGQSSPAAAKLPDNLMALQSRIRGCLLSDAGVVQYYTGATDRTKKEDMVTPSVLTGADGQVMVEVPQGWLKYWYANSKHYYLISKEQFNGASRLDAFYKNDEWVKNRYMSAYEGILYDDSESTYVNGIYYPATATRLFTFTAVDDKIQAVAGTSAAFTHPFAKIEVGHKLVITNTINNNITVTIATKGDDYVTTNEALTDEADVQAIIGTQKNWTPASGDKLSSVSGKAPINQGTRANFRAVTKNRGTGWRQQDYDLVSTIQLFYLVEYASWYSQSMIGNGLTNFGGTNWTNRNNQNPIEAAGLSNSLGNISGGVDNGANSLGSYMSYRGIENFFGHLWKWVDGINIGGAAGADDYKVHVCNNDVNFADDTWTNYTDLEIVLSNLSGWEKTLEQIARGFLPASVGGGLATYITDYDYQGAGWRMVALGGSATVGDGAGTAAWAMHISSSGAYSYFGGRLSY